MAYYHPHFTPFQNNVKFKKFSNEWKSSVKTFEVTIHKQKICIKELKGLPEYYYQIILTNSRDITTFPLWWLLSFIVPAFHQYTTTNFYTVLNAS